MNRQVRPDVLHRLIAAESFDIPRAYLHRREGEPLKTLCHVGIGHHSLRHKYLWLVTYNHAHRRIQGSGAHL